MKLRHALLASALLAAAPAEAAEYIITYEGTVSSSHDQTGEFGTPGGSLDGLAFTAVYTLTAPMPGAVTYDDGTLAYIYGGSAYSAPTPLSGTLTINGVTQAFSGDHFGYAYQSNRWDGTGNYDQVYHNAQDYDPDGGSDGTYHNNNLNTSIYSYVNDFLATQDYTAPLTYSVQPGDIRYGDFQLHDYTNFGNNVSRNAYGRLTSTSVTIALAPVTGAVPEPATWAMMLAGFGLIGGAMRRRRRQARLG